MKDQLIDSGPVLIDRDVGLGMEYWALEGDSAVAEHEVDDERSCSRTPC